MSKNDWTESVTKCNEAIHEVSKILEEKRIEMTDRIADICNKHKLDVNTDFIVGSYDNSMFTVRLNGNTSKAINFPKKFLDEIDMGFAVKRELDRMGNNVLYIVFYPLDE